ncbi:MAG: anti-sigma factor [Planctomycetota bacterium]
MNATPPTNGRADDRPIDRLEELLADRAVFGLDAEEAAELERLLATTGRTDDTTYDLAAATVSAAGVAVDEPLPAVLRDRVLDDAAEMEPKATPAPAGPLPPPTKREWPVYTMFAIAAGLLISLYLGTPGGELSLIDQRAALVASADDLVRVAWTPQDDPAVIATEDEEAPHGDVVWSDANQAGYMRFRGLKANDPTVEQYQLWVFDEDRNADYPVDGGVFDIVATDDGEQIVPIDAKLPISKATLFAITVEKPGGVVVSDRSRLPLLAQR